MRPLRGRRPDHGHESRVMGRAGWPVVEGNPAGPGPDGSNCDAVSTSSNNSAPITGFPSLRIRGNPCGTVPEPGLSGYQRATGMTVTMSA
jgi:hypothetical protein